MNAKEIIEITKDNQIEQLNRRIHELECQIQREKKVEKRTYQFDKEGLGESMGLTKEQIDELNAIISHWFHKHGNRPSKIIQMIEDSPLPYREKAYMNVCIGIDQGIAYANREGK